MPSILIEVRKAYSPEEETAIINAVHDALVACFKNPPEDKNVRLLAHPPHRFACSDTRKKPEAFTHITIDCLKGRSLDTKRKLYKTICECLTPFGIPAEEVEILIREIDHENCGIRGGKAACDIDLGFRVDV